MKEIKLIIILLGVQFKLKKSELNKIEIYEIKNVFYALCGVLYIL